MQVLGRPPNLVAYRCKPESQCTRDNIPQRPKLDVVTNNSTPRNRNSALSASLRQSSHVAELQARAATHVYEGLLAAQTARDCKAEYFEQLGLRYI